MSLCDWLIAASFAQASSSSAAWAGADIPTTAVLLGGLAIVEAGAVVVLRARASERLGLRGSIAWLAVVLATVGALLVIGAPSPNWPLILVLTAGLLATAAFALVESEPLWLFASGVFLLFDYHMLLVALLPANALDRQPYTLENLWLSLSSYHVLLIAALWLLGIVLGTGTARRRLTMTIYGVALLDALYVTFMVVGRDHTYATFVLTLFAVLALLAGVRDRQPLAGNLFVVFFGWLATLPFTAGNETNGVAVALVALVPAAVALVIRRCARVALVLCAIRGRLVGRYRRQQPPHH